MFEISNVLLTIAQGEANVRWEAANHRQGNRQELPPGAAREQVAEANECERFRDAKEREIDGESAIRQRETRNTRGCQQ